MKKRFLILLIVSLILTLTPAAVSAASESDDIVIGIAYSKLSTSNYSSAVTRAGADPYKLPLIKTSADARKYLSRVDALILPGGYDIHPKYYNAKSTKYLEAVSTSADLSDMLLLKAAKEMDIPVLGICRGLQVMNVAQGGTLYQDINAYYPYATSKVVHRDPAQRVAVTHSIDIVSGSELHKALGKTRTKVYSWHHQAIRKLGSGLTVTARSDDGLIEAIEYNDQRFMLGVHFHPEKDVLTKRGNQINIFYELIDQGYEYRQEVYNSLTAPGSADAVLYGHDNVQLSWDKVTGAGGYAIYYKQASSANYARLARTTGTSYKTGDLTDGVVYDFKIVPYIRRGSSFYEIDAYAATSIRTLKQLSAPAVTEYSDTDVTASWEDIEDQDGYQISRSTSSTGTNIIATKETADETSTVIEAGSTKGRPYYFKVRAYKDENGTLIYGPWSPVTKYTRQLPAPDSINTKLYGHDDVQVSWSKVSGASGYGVYYKKESSSSYTFLGRTTYLYMKKANLTDGITYDFKVVPYYKSGSSRYYSVNSVSDSILTLKKVSGVTAGKNLLGQVKMSWNDIDGESGYQISRSAKKTGTNIVLTIDAEDETSAALSKGTKGKYYYYKVRAYKVVGDKKIYAPWSSVVKYKR